VTAVQREDNPPSRRNTSPVIPGRPLHKRAAARAIPRVGSGSLADQATHAFRRSIMSGQFASGRLPPEPELALLLAVSRTTCGWHCNG